MSNGNPQEGSIWPVVTVIVGLVALGALGWDVMLQGRVKKMEERVSQMEHAARIAAAAVPKSSKGAAAVETPAAAPASSRRHKGAATRPATTQAPAPAPTPADGSK